MLLTHEDFFLRFDHVLCVFAARLSYLHLLWLQLFMDAAQRHTCMRNKNKSLPILHNLIWPRTQSALCYIICFLHFLGSPVFSLSAFYRLQFCCSAPNKRTEDVINTGYFAFEPERINFMWNNMNRFITYFISLTGLKNYKPCLNK